MKSKRRRRMLDGLLYWEREFHYTVIREGDEHEKQTPAPNA